MKSIRTIVWPACVILILFVPFSTAFGQLPLPCSSPAPHECIPNDVDFDDDMDGNCNEDEINGEDDDGDGRIDEDPYPPMCEWAACQEDGTNCSPHSLKYYRHVDLLTTNENILRAVIVVHGRRDKRETVDDRSWNYYNHIFNAADDLGLLNETLILAPLFDRASKCPVNASNECIKGAGSVDNPKCGGNADSDGRLCWKDPPASDYPSGGNAHNDGHLRSSSFKLIDEMINTIAHLKDIGIFPNLNTIVVTGQSAGGQFSLRYAMAGTAQPTGIAMRYVPCNPGEMTYLNGLRPTEEAKNSFPNIGYNRDCDGDGIAEAYDPPGVKGLMSNTEAWSSYPVSYDFPDGFLWEDEDGDLVDCVSDSAYDNWPRGIADVSTGNDYMFDRGITPNDILAHYLRRDVILHFGINDNLYVGAKIEKDCGAPEGPSVGNCMQAVQGHARVERGAFFFKHTSCGFGRGNHRLETVWLDRDGDGVVEIGDGYGHGGLIYESDATRAAIFFDEQPRQWGKTLGGLENERAVAVERSPDGGYVVLGETSSYGAGSQDLWIIKLDRAGTILWHRTYGGTGYESAAAVTASPEGGYLVVGTTSSVTSGGQDAWLVKIDESGAVEWGRSYGGPLRDRGVAVVTTSDCKYVIGGTTQDPDTSHWDIWLMKWDSNDGVIWHKTYDGSHYESISSLQRSWDGGFIIAGESRHVAGRNGDFRVLKVDSNGSIEWDKAYGLDGFVAPGAPRNENIEYAPYIRQTNDGGYVLAGTTVSWIGKHMVWLLKLSEDGTISWEKLFSAPGDCDLSAIEPTGDNGYLLSGTTGDGWMMKLDEDGNKEWINYYGGGGPALRDEIYSFQSASDGGLIAVGATESLSASDEDLWVLKLDKSGQIPECAAIGSGFLAAEEDPSEEAVVISSGIDEEWYLASTWSATVSQPPSERVFVGDGCNPNILTDLIDLPRTGQTTPHHAGDDGHIQAGTPWPSPRFVDNGDGTVTDYLTGLIWLKDSDCMGAAAWEEGLNNVANFNENPELYSCTDYDTENHKDDWRAPNINEIESLVNAQTHDNAAWLNAQGFVNAKAVWHWSSSTPSLTYRRWAIHMEIGEMSRSYGPGSIFQMWPVRGGQKDYWDPNFPANVWKTGQKSSFHPGDDGHLQMGVMWPSKRFQDNQDGTVTDNLTGLMWLKDMYCFETPTHSGGLSWENGLDTVADFNSNPGNYDCVDYDVDKHEGDWRVPNRKELLSILAWYNAGPALPDGHPFILDANVHPYWASTTYNNDGQSPMAWIAYPTGPGGLKAMLKKHTGPTFWPVRGEIHGNAVRNADFDGDGDVDGRELAILAAAFGSQIGNINFNPATDLMGDNTIDVRDLQAFIPHLGRTDCPCY